MHNTRHELQFDLTNERTKKNEQNETETVENKLKLTCNASPKDATSSSDKGEESKREGGRGGTYMLHRMGYERIFPQKFVK